ncbi:PWI domain-containing protein [Tothia fuscella]|uniref:PWI domain-containing protein n=1 Tax=Tothia fuscella TaxID=1048955 RepID=A0A9P4NL39_9PEZI|nr:PWI domain-containing protein [Tothia fuscella]
MDSAQLKLVKQTKFPDNFNKKVDTRKLNMPVIKTWIKDKLPQVLKLEDDIFIDMTCELIDQKNDTFPKIKEIQIHLTGFLGKKAAASFCEELWALMLDAQTNPKGIPNQLIEAKKEEIKKAFHAKAASDARRRSREEDRLRREREETPPRRSSFHDDRNRGRYRQNNFEEDRYYGYSNYDSRRRARSRSPIRPYRDRSPPRRYRSRSRSPYQRKDEKDARIMEEKKNAAKESIAKAKAIVDRMNAK